MITEYKLTQEEISKKLSKSRSAIANCMRLLNLDNRVQQYIIEGVISEGHGRAILAVEDKNLQYEISQKVIDEELNVRQTEKYIKNYSIEKKKKTSKSLNPYYKELENRLENYFDTKVSLNCKNKNKGKIEIEYYSEEDLQRILDLLKL